ncbi:MAG: hypothetical protein QM778_26240 [Myxococcales bacterium]
MPYREPEHHEREPSAPAYEEGPIAWENAALSWPRRFLSTLNASFLPTATARAVAENPRVAPALGFALLSALPWAPLWAIVPFTHTLQFKPNFALEQVPKQGLSLAADLARAGAIGLALTLVSLLTWSVPFASLLRAFAKEPMQPLAPSAAYRTALYRLWLVPFGMSMFWLSVWAMPMNAPAVLGDLTLVGFQILPRLLIVLHCHAQARYFGASSAGAMVVASVPLAVEWAAGLWVWHVTRSFLPEMPPSSTGGAG